VARLQFALKPYPLQQEVIDHLDGKIRNVDGDPYRFLVLAIGRQAGKSWLAKYLLLMRAAAQAQRCMWVAPTIPTARGHWDNLVSMIERSGMPVKKISQAAKQIIFPEGGEITVRSAVEPDNLRGGTLDLIVLDEAAFYRDGVYLWYSVILPMVTASNGKVLFTSTPSGRNWFYDLYQNGQDPNNILYKSWQAPSSVSPYQDKKLLEALRKEMPELQWREEFMAEFLADGSSVFAGAEEAATVEMQSEPTPGVEYVAGIDFGFNHDATTATIIDKLRGQQVFGIRFFNYGTLGTIRRLTELMRLWKPSAITVERNGIGESLFSILKAALGDTLTNYISDETVLEMLQQPKLSNRGLEEGPPTDNAANTSWGGRLKAVHMDNKTKREYVEKLAAAIEFKRLATLAPVPGSYAHIQLNEMSTYIRERTQSGLDITYNAAKGSYDDTISALYLAYSNVNPKVDSITKLLSTDEPVLANPFRRGGVRHLTRKRR
jgi:Terminase large subunit, T4likevirus-type, N-terminal